MSAVEVDLQAFAKENLGLDTVAPGRYSELLVAQLYVGYKSRSLFVWDIIDEIRVLETGGASIMKGPTQFRHLPFKGLWHKHYMRVGIGAFALNLKKGLEKHSAPTLKRVDRAAKKNNVEPYMTEEEVIASIHEGSVGIWERLARSGEVTGDWIIYAEHKGQNYYLSLCPHDASHHELVHSQMEASCFIEFPFINNGVDILTK